MEPGAGRRRLEQTLSCAYGEGLLSENTLALRLDMLLSGTLIDPAPLVGDLTRRAPRRPQLATLWGRLQTWIDGSDRRQPATLLALDWNGGHERLLVGRHWSCDVVLDSPNVSRRHARLLFRDGSWIVRDLDSTNGTHVNGVSVGRCELKPGDELVIGAHRLRID